MDNLKFIHNTINYWIEKADNKANIIMGLKVFILGYFLTIFKTFDLSISLIAVEFSLYILFSLLSFYFILNVVHPRLATGEPSSLIYFKHVADKYRHNKKQGIKDLSTIDDKSMLEDLSNQIISLSIVADSKYKKLRTGVLLLIFETMFLIILIYG